MSGVRCRTAEKDMRCDVCSRMIPAGHKYWRKVDKKGVVTHREHTNCINYNHQPVMEKK